MQAKDYIGKRMMFTGADDNQAKWAGNADPRSFFVEGDVATVRTINIAGPCARSNGYGTHDRGRGLRRADRVG